MISQNELLTDDDELKRLPYRSGKKKGIYVKSKMSVLHNPASFLLQLPIAEVLEEG